MTWETSSQGFNVLVCFYADAHLRHRINRSYISYTESATIYEWKGALGTNRCLVRHIFKVVYSRQHCPRERNVAMPLRIS